MKKSILFILSFVFITFIISCKNDSVNADDDETNTNEEVTTDETVDVTESTLLNPDNIDISKPIPVADLKKAVFAWNGKEVTVIGYCDVMFSYGTVKDEVSLAANPDSSELIYCDLVTEYEGEKVEQTTPIVIKGTIEGAYFEGVSLVDCEIVSIGGDIIENNNLNPEKLPDNPIYALNLHKAYYAWNEKTVSVIGYYHSTTTSTTDYGTTVRIDLSDPETGEKAVGCRMLEEPTEDLANNRNDVVIKGILRGEVFGIVLMEECELVK